MDKFNAIKLTSVISVLILISYVLTTISDSVSSHNFAYITLTVISILTLITIYLINSAKSQYHALQSSQHRLESLMDTLPDATLFSNRKGEIIQVNQQAEQLFGYCFSELMNMTIDQLIPDQYTSAQGEPCIQQFDPENSHQTAKQYFVRLKSGDMMEVAINFSINKHQNSAINIISLRDITEFSRTSKELDYHVSHDTLTGLYNRFEFESHLESLCNSADNKQRHSLCFLNLDQFKIINDLAGHTAGDALLVQIANLLEEQCRDSDIIARLGGDEFGILMMNISPKQTQYVAKRVISLIEGFRFTWGTDSYSIGISIGITEINGRTSTHTELLKQADIACFSAKKMGGNHFHVYEGSDKQVKQYSDEMNWVNRIHAALENSDFVLYAQEIRPTTPQATHVNYEILIRMLDEDGSTIPPGAFLPAAERYQLIGKIDYWVINATFRWMVEHAAKLNDKTHISINLSGLSIGNETVQQHITEWFDSGLIPPHKIHFEITETMAIANLHKANTFISTIKAYGCGFSLDDFGSGLSSFGYLKQLAVNTVKIDGVFVRDILDDPIDAAMVESINTIGHVMGMETIAEFVENDEIANKLKEIGVDYLQGYGIGKPMPIDDILLNNSTPEKIRLAD